MKIQQLATSYPRYPGDHASIFLRHLGNCLVGDGHEIRFTVPADDSSGERSEAGVMVNRVAYLPGGTRRLAYGHGIPDNLKSNPLLWFQVPFFLSGMLTATLLDAYRHRPDVIHAHWILPMGLIGVIVGRLLDIPVVVTTHGSDAFGLRSRPATRLKRWTLKHCAAWTANSRQTADALPVDSLGTRNEIIPMGIDVRHFSHDRPHSDKQVDRGATLLYVGRFARVKGIETLLEAFARVLEKRPDVRLLLVGDGAQRPFLETECKRLDIVDRVTFHGMATYDELPALYAQADLFILPSRPQPGGETEGQGLVCLEAAAAGLPVIASDTGGIRQFVRDGITGRLVPPGDPEALAETILEIMGNPSEAAALATRAQTEARKHDWSIIAERFSRLYETVVKHS